MKAKFNMLVLAVSVLMFTNPMFAQSSGGSGGSSSGNSSGDAIVPLPMIQSEDALRNYALSIAVFGSRAVYASSLDWSWSESHSYTNLAGSYGEEILDKLMESEFVYRLVNPADEIRGYVYLYDAPFGGNNSPTLLFFGWASYALTSKANYSVHLMDVPLPLSGVEYAEILVMGKDGSTAHKIRLNITDEGKPMFPPRYAGSPNGIMSVRFQNGTTTVYNLANPIGGLPAVGAEEGKQDYQIQGHYVLNSGGQRFASLNITEVWERPSVFLKITSASCNVTMNVMGLVQKDGNTYFERPAKMLVQVVGEAGEPEIVVLSEDGGDTFPVPPGEYRITFIWNEFGKPSTIYIPTDDGGGKG